MGEQHPDLFGGETAIAREAKDHAHAAPVGSGPAGETCGTCANFRRLDYFTSRKKSYFKCKLVLSTHGPGTDIRKRDAACREWDECPAQREG